MTMRSSSTKPISRSASRQTCQKGFWSRVLDLEVLQNTPALRIYKVTRCLWATTFREAGAADIGYAMWCYGDYAMAKSKQELLERNFTLVQGHDCCLLKYTKNA